MVLTARSASEVFGALKPLSASSPTNRLISTHIGATTTAGSLTNILQTGHLSDTPYADKRSCGLSELLDPEGSFDSFLDDPVLVDRKDPRFDRKPKSLHRRPDAFVGPLAVLSG